MDAAIQIANSATRHHSTGTDLCRALVAREARSWRRVSREWMTRPARSRLWRRRLRCSNKRKNAGRCSAALSGQCGRRELHCVQLRTLLRAVFFPASRDILDTT